MDREGRDVRPGGVMEGTSADSAALARSSPVRWALGTALWPWALSRLVVGAALATSRELSSGLHLSAGAAARVHEGLLGWDAGWYESIARHGYWGAGHSSLRFFPLVPLATKALSGVLPIGPGASLVLLANACALCGAAWLAALVRRECADDSLARRSAWLVCLAPPAFTFVMGYAESTLLLLSVATFWALRSRRWAAAGAIGCLAGLCRPVGVLLALAALVEACRGWRGTPWGQKLARAGAVAGPVLGFAAYLGWVGWRYGDAFAPLSIQQESGHRGAFADPLRTLAHDASLLAHGHHLGSALHLPWALVALALLVLTFRVLPASYGVYCAAVLLAALTAANLDGLERYALSAFPLVVAASTLTRSRRVELVVLVGSGAGLACYSVLAFTNLYVP